jgi:hypothetical protein
VSDGIAVLETTRMEGVDKFHDSFCMITTEILSLRCGGNNIKNSILQVRAVRTLFILASG